MTDLEQRLRNEFQGEIDRLPSEMPVGAPSRVHRKVRRRQTTIVASAALIAAAAAGLAFIARGALDDRASVRPAESPAATGTKDGMTLVAEGSHEGTTWEYYLYQEEDGDWCTSIYEDGYSSGSSCGRGDTDGAMDPGTQGPSYDLGSEDPDPYFIEGELSLEVAQVVVELDGEPAVEATIYRPPSELGAPFNLFIVAVDATQETIRGSITAFDANSQVLETEDLPLGQSGIAFQHIPPDATVMASGPVGDREWEVLAFLHPEADSQWCLGYRFPRGRGFNCGNDIARDVVFSAHTNSEGYATLVYGAVSPEVASAQVQIFDGGPTPQVRIVEAPGDSGVPFNVFWALIEGKITGGRVVAYDDSGNVLAMEDLFVPFPIAEDGSSSVSEGG